MVIALAWIQVYVGSNPTAQTIYAELMELVDIADLESAAARRQSSSLWFGTSNNGK